MGKQLGGLFLAVSLAITGCSRPGSRQRSAADSLGSQSAALTTYKLKSISVTPTPSTVFAGASVALTATGNYTDGGSANLTDSATWSSSNTAVATVTSTGQVTTLDHGSATISAVVGTVTGKATVKVSVSLTSIAVTPGATSLPANTTQILVATGSYDNGTTKNLTTTAAWTSSNPAVATVSANGVVTALAPGTATMTATYASASLSSISGSATVTVTSASVTSVAVTPAKKNLPKGTSAQLTATATYSDGTKHVLAAPYVTWSSSATSIAAISAAGLATGVATGSATITAASVPGGVSGTAKLTVTAATLVSIGVTPPMPTVSAGMSQAFVATGTYSDGSTLDITNQATWSSSATAVATIASGGLASGVAPGSATITAALSGKSGTAKLTVTSAVLESIALSPASPSLPGGSSLQLTATGTFSDGSTEDVTPAVTWSSSNGSIASISNATGTQGLVQGLAAGSTTLSATDPTTGVTQSETLTVTAATVVSIAVTPAAPSLPLGNSLQLAATATYSDQSTRDVTQTVTWASSSPTAVVVSNAPDSSGEITAAAAGASVLSATDPASGKSGQTTVTVTAATLKAIQVAPVSATIAAGDTQAFTATGTYTDNSTQDITSAVTWSSSNGDASVSNAAGSNGQATGLAVGTSTLSATYPGTSISGTATLKVSAASLVGIEIAPGSPTLQADGGTQAFTATGVYSDSSTHDLTTAVTWASSSPSVATISNVAATQGVSTAVSAGTTTISATLGGVVGTTTLTVVAPTLVGLSVTPTSPSVPVGETQAFAATGTYSDGSTQDLTSTATWSSNSASATITAAGLATAVAVGSATLTATDPSGTYSASATLTVTAPALASLTVTPASASIATGATQAFVATGTYSDGSTQTLTSAVSWTSSSGAATVSPAGVATGVAVGSATLTATLGGVLGSGQLVVTSTMGGGGSTSSSGTTGGSGAFKVVFQPGGYLGPYTTPVASSVTGATSAYLNAGSYTLSLPWIGNIYFQVDTQGNVTSTSSQSATGGPGTLTLLNTTVQVNPVGYLGPYEMDEGPPMPAAAGTQSYVLIPGPGLNWSLAFPSIGQIPFTIDGSNNVSTTSDSAIGGPASLTLKNVSVAVDPQAYLGAYEMDEGPPTPAAADKQTYVLIPGSQLAWSLAFPFIGQIPFTIDASNTGSNLVSTSSVSAIGGPASLTLKNVSVAVDPQAYLGAYEMDEGPPTPAAAGKQAYVLIPGPQLKWALELPFIGQIPFAIDASNDGGSNVSTTSDSAIGGAASLTLKNVSVAVDPQGYLGAYEMEEGPPTPAAAGSQTFALIPGSQLNWSIELPFIGQIPFTIDASNDGGSNVSTTSDSAIGGPSSLTLQNATVAVNPQSYLGAYVMDEGPPTPAAAGSQIYVLIPGLQLKWALELPFIGQVPFAIDSLDNVSTTSDSATAAGSVLTLLNVQITANPGAYSGVISIDSVSGAGTLNATVVPGANLNQSVGVNGFGETTFTANASCELNKSQVVVGPATITLGCAPSCPASQTLCLGQCVDLTSDPNNCGACGNTCQPNASCTNGICVNAGTVTSTGTTSSTGGSAATSTATSNTSAVGTTGGSPTSSTTTTGGGSTSGGTGSADAGTTLTTIDATSQAIWTAPAGAGPMAVLSDGDVLIWEARERFSSATGFATDFTTAFPDDGGFYGSAGPMPMIFPYDGVDSVFTSFENNHVFSATGAWEWSWLGPGCCNYAQSFAWDRVNSIIWTQSWYGGATPITTLPTLPPDPYPSVTPGNSSTTSFIALDGTSLYFAGSSGIASMTNTATNAQVWQVTVDSTSALRNGAIASDGSFVVTSTAANHGLLAAINPTGTLTFSVDLGASTEPVIGGDGSIYVGSSLGATNAIASYSPAGALQWSAPVQGSPMELLVADDGLVYGILSNGEVVGLAQSGGALTRDYINLDSGGELMLSNGQLFAHTQSNLYALPTTAQNYAPAASWPLRQHDNMRQSSWSPPPCPGTGTRCSGPSSACTDTTSDSNNCGGCGIACQATESCIAGWCQSTSTVDACNGAYLSGYNSTALLGIQISPPAANVLASADGGTFAFTAEGFYANAPQTPVDITSQVTWTSNSPGVVAVASGTASYGTSVGEVALTATIGSLSASANMRIWDPSVFASITALVGSAPGAYNMSSGACTPVSMVAQFADGGTQDVTSTALWGSSCFGRVIGQDLFVATGPCSDNYGSFSGSLGLGDLSTTISTAIWGPVLSGTCDDPRSPGPLWGVTVTGASNIYVGEAAQYSAQGQYADGTTRDISSLVTWGTCGPTLLQMDPDGLGTGRAVGSGYLAAAAFNGVSGVANVNITPAPPLGTLTGLTLNPENVNAALGATYLFRAIGAWTGVPGHLMNVTGQSTWSAADPAVTSFADGSGTGLSLGETQITAALDGLSVTGNVEVWDPARLASITSFAVSGNGNMGYGTTQQWQLLAYFNGSTTDYQDVSSTAIWTPASNCFGTLSTTGFFSADGACTNGYDFLYVTFGHGNALIPIEFGIWGDIPPSTTSTSSGGGTSTTSTITTSSTTGGGTGTYPDGGEESSTTAGTGGEGATSNTSTAGGAAGNGSATSNTSGTGGPGTTGGATATSGSSGTSGSLCGATPACSQVGGPCEVNSDCTTDSCEPLADGGVGSVCQPAGAGGPCSSDGDCQDNQCSQQGSLGFCSGQNWVASNLGPPPRVGGSMVYDSSANAVMLFGGSGALAVNGGASILYQDLNDTWLWTGGSNWTQAQPQVSPPGRFSAGLAYDSSRNVAVLFGGYASSGQYFNDTWEWDGLNWTERAPSASPSPRLSGAMAYDAQRNVTVLFGGSDANGNSLDDTWEWNGTTWTLLAPQASPPPRADAATAFDSAHNVTWLFGGNDNSTYLNDLWQWDGANWTQISTVNGPPSSDSPMMTFDSSRQVTLLAEDVASSAGAPINQTWEWDGTSWTLEQPSSNAEATASGTMAYDSSLDLTIVTGGTNPYQGYVFGTSIWNGVTWASTQPPPSINPNLAYDAARGSTVLFGGWNQLASDPSGWNLNGTWEWNGSDWSELQPTTSPPGRYTAGMVYDSNRALTVLFGGQGAEGDLADTWEWNGTNWSQITTDGGPSARAWVSMAYDSQRGVAVLFGGADPSNSALADTWEYDGTAWIQKTPSTSPPARLGSSLAYDSARHVVVLFGGYSSGAPTNDTWEWDGSNWTQVATASAPPARYVASMVFDSTRNVVELFGGATNSIYLSDVWEWNGSAWTQANPSVSPSPRGQAGMAFDSCRNVSILFGGYGSPYAYLADTWTYAPAGWNPAAAPPSCSAAGCLATNGQEMCSGVCENTLTDANNCGGCGITCPAGAACLAGLCVVSGQSTATSTTSGVTSTVSSITTSSTTGGGTGTYPDGGEESSTTAGTGGEGATSNTSTTGGATSGMASATSSTSGAGGGSGTTGGAGSTPPDDYFTSMVYDAFRNQVVLYTAEGYSSSELWDWSGTAWTQQSPAVMPPARDAAHLAYDSDRHVSVLFGGQVQNGGQSIGDTWEWNGTTWAQIQAAGSPSARYAGTMVYDPVRQVTVLFGGATGSATGATAYNDTWEWDGTNWTQMQPANSPPARYAGTMAFDSLHNVTVLFGGYDPSMAINGDDTTSYINDTWTWDGTNWTQQVPATSPGPRAWASMAYDSIRNVSVVFGGNSDVANFDDTWTWDGTNWTQQNPATSPPERIGASMVFDSVVQASVLISGAYSGGTNDTWLWNGTTWSDGTYSDGGAEEACSTDLSSDPNNCGGCGIQCVNGAACTNGTCSCSGTTPNECAAGAASSAAAVDAGASSVICTNVETDSQNCGACGNLCVGSCTLSCNSCWYSTEVYGTNCEVCGRTYFGYCDECLFYEEVYGNNCAHCGTQQGQLACSEGACSCQE